MSTKSGHIGGPELGLPELRETERRARRPGSAPKSVWQLFGNGSVGSQALTGIPVVARLCNDPGLSTVSRVWPFEVTVPDLDEGLPAIVHSEIWPSLIRIDPVGGHVKDEAQVLGLAVEFRERDREGILGQLFSAVTDAGAEEGWFLGVR